ncbi:MAG: hypothetical protein DWQ31_13165 [Planctomycetota bacterium]|nr:MAG: hypothetical protein DWQ31_13165 [Planctomycetota bacterium]REJ87085.1 MAG: hypothetical protein DWQ35_22045 [Planctomycetota bacterium]REK26997.1 MAG: hypothetical protein DWQ42_08030 [Planctomycetota bacterium]REK47276.1 MAG: hypothetical protein DWQ46_04580 [Planctomycetota bacterium]
MAKKTRNKCGPVRGAVFAGSLMGAAALTAPAIAQDSSLYRQGLQATGGPISLQQVSLIWREYEPPPEVKLHDVITIVVDEKSLYQSRADLIRNKEGSIDAILQDNPVLDNFNLRPSPQSAGDPALRASFESESQAQSQLRVSDRIAFRIAVKVVEIRPNGNLVLEGHRQILNNEETHEMSLTGIIRPDKVDAGNIARAEDVAELRISKLERGEIRDGYRRGWLLRFLDRIQTF